MSPISYADCYGLEECANTDPIAVGDIVRTGSSSYPRYEVMAIRDDMAWIKDVQNGSHGVTGLHHCNKICPTDPQQD